MKRILSVMLIAFTFTAASSALAGYYDFDESNRGCGDNDCEYCTTCQCTDLGAGKNYCMSLSKYCEAFGNIGAR